jgi:Ca2+-binding EF-hand superfamily protein
VFKEFQSIKNLGMTREHVYQLFNAFDVNRNGMIDYSEFLASFVLSQIKDFEGYIGEVFSQVDTNSDGKISKAEIKSFFVKHSTFFQTMNFEKVFSSLDSDKDGFIDPAELKTSLRKAMERNLEHKLDELESEDPDLFSSTDK